MEINIKERRPIATRDKTWAKNSARWLKNRGVTPNQISFASMVCALLAGGALLFAFDCPSPWGRAAALLLAVLMIQGRLLCNLLDGMAGPAGPVWNELPDRISDSLILIGAGYGLTLLQYGATFGWCAALLALMTAYLRLLGGVCGLEQQFLGPMAKQHRMALLCGGALLAMVLPAYWGQQLLYLCLIVINIGTAITCWRRGKRILDKLNDRAGSQGERYES